MRARTVLAAFAALIASHAAAWAEASELRVSKGFGLHYLPLYIMEKQRLVEKHAAGLGGEGVKTLKRPPKKRSPYGDIDPDVVDDEL